MSRDTSRYQELYDVFVKHGYPDRRFRARVYRLPLDADGGMTRFKDQVTQIGAYPVEVILGSIRLPDVKVERHRFANHTTTNTAHGVTTKPGPWLVALVEGPENELHPFGPGGARYEAAQAFVLGALHGFLEGELIDKNDTYDYLPDWCERTGQLLQQGYSPRNLEAFQAALTSDAAVRFSASLSMFGSAFGGNTLHDFLMTFAALESLAMIHFGLGEADFNAVKDLYLEVLGAHGFTEDDATLKRGDLGRLYGRRGEFMHNGLDTYPTRGQVLLLRRLYWLLIHHAVGLPLDHLLAHFAPASLRHDEGHMVTGPSLSTAEIADIIKSPLAVTE